MTKTIREILELVQGSVAYADDSLEILQNQRELYLAEIQTLIEQARPPLSKETRGSNQSQLNDNYLTRRAKAHNDAINEYETNLKELLK